ncbi:MAG: DUF6421 family protein, partial [Rhodoglobus sp.]
MSRTAASAVVGEPEVLEDVASHPAWLDLKGAAGNLREIQAQDGSVPEAGEHANARDQVSSIVVAIRALAP